MVRQVVFEEDPGTSDLRSGDLSRLGARAQFLRMAAQERSGFLEIESLHGSIPDWLYEHSVRDGESHHADNPAATRIKDAVRAGESEPVAAQRGAGC